MDAPGQLDVGDALGVDDAEARVLEEADEVDLAGLLERHDRSSSESASRSCSHGQLIDELRALLVASDLAEVGSFQSVAVRLLHAFSRRRTLPGRPSSRAAFATLCLSLIFARSIRFFIDVFTLS